jgi:bacterial/archaeal transporter family-2 protein
MKLTWYVIAFLSGAFLPIQAGLNTRLGKVIANPLYASMISFVVGAATVACYILFTKQQVSWAGIKSAPAYVWIGGALGAFYVTAIILSFPRIGPALTFGLVVAGQIIISVLLDHFNVLVAQQHSINIWRIFGIVLIIAGVIIVRKF